VLGGEGAGELRVMQTEAVTLAEAAGREQSHLLPTAFLHAGVDPQTQSILAVEFSAHYARLRAAYAIERSATGTMDVFR